MKDDPDIPREKPAPAHPEERTTDLPWKTPKPASDDIDAVVVATDGGTASKLLSGVQAPRWRSTTCLYYGAEAPPLTGPYLVLADNPDQPVNNLCVMSEVSRGCAPEGLAHVPDVVPRFDARRVLGTSYPALSG